MKEHIDKIIKAGYSYVMGDHNGKHYARAMLYDNTTVPPTIKELIAFYKDSPEEALQELANKVC